MLFRFKSGQHHQKNLIKATAFAFMMPGHLSNLVHAFWPVLPKAAAIKPNRKKARAQIHVSKNGLHAQCAEHVTQVPHVGCSFVRLECSLGACLQA